MSIGYYKGELMSLGILVAIIGIIAMVLYITVKFWRLYKKSKPKL
jgi:hypothetical protein